MAPYDIFWLEEPLHWYLQPADYVRLAGHYGFAPDFCHANDPQSKGIVEHLCGYAQRDLAVRC